MSQFTYEPWRHGGWYVLDVQYPSGAVGCVSRNYPDKKWRIVCGNNHEQTFRSRDDAAQAEWDLVQAEWVKVRASLEYKHAVTVCRELSAETLELTATYAHVSVSLRVAARDVRVERQARAT